MKFGATVIFVNDVRAALDFYQRAFGFEPRFFDAAYGYGELETGGPAIAFASHELGGMLLPGTYVRSERGFSVEIAFLTTDVPAAFATALRAGATAVAEPKTMPWGATVAYVRGTEGTLIGLSTPIGGDND